MVVTVVRNLTPILRSVARAADQRSAWRHDGMTAVLKVSIRGGMGYWTTGASAARRIQ